MIPFNGTCVVLTTFGLSGSVYEGCIWRKRSWCRESLLAWPRGGLNSSYWRKSRCYQYGNHGLCPPSEWSACCFDTCMEVLVVGFFSQPQTMLFRFWCCGPCFPAGWSAHGCWGTCGGIGCWPCGCWSWAGAEVMTICSKSDSWCTKLDPVILEFW